MTTSWPTKIVVIKNHLKLTDDPDQDDLISSLAEVEKREGERRGWDQDPQVWSLLRPQPGRVLLSQIPSDAWRFGHGNPVDDLATLARTAPPLPVVRLRRDFGTSPDGFIAIALMCEAWSVLDDKLSDADRKAQEEGKRQFHLHPNRIESRMITAADINGVIYNVIRHRGQAPQYSVQNPSGAYGGESSVAGRLPRVLTRLAYGASLPEASEMTDN